MSIFDKKHFQQFATLFFGSLILLFIILVVIFAPDSLPQYKHRLIAILSSVLAGLFAYFFTGAISLLSSSNFSLLGKISVRAAGGAAIFIFTMMWWYSDFAPIKVQKRSAIVEVIEAEDVHLGDNVLPEKWGYNHNPLFSSIYPQKSKGLIYYDKATGSFLAGSDNQTHIGQFFVNNYAAKIKDMDFSGFKFVSVHETGNPVPDILKKYVDRGDHSRFVKLQGGSILYTNKDNKGSFYERYAAVGAVRAIDFAIPLAKENMDFREEAVADIEFIIECYHGGIESGQPENFAFLFNGKIHEIKTLSRNMREKEVTRVKVPVSEINFRQENIVAVFVLPWQEEKPKAMGTNRGPTHFRDVGIINAYFKVNAR